ncbi:hypothetical protein V8C40DRAFT_283785 [Trichoderma camerunense]
MYEDTNGISGWSTTRLSVTKALWGTFPAGPGDADTQRRFEVDRTASISRAGKFIGVENPNAFRKGKKKAKGQNIDRSFGRFDDAIPLCNSRAYSAEFSPKECQYGDGCKMCHDLRKYLSEGRREDVKALGRKCPAFEAYGYCASGWKCRFVKSHMQEPFPSLEHGYVSFCQLLSVLKSDYSRRYEYNGPGRQIRRRTQAPAPATRTPALSFTPKHSLPQLDTPTPKRPRGDEPTTPGLPTPTSASRQSTRLSTLPVVNYSLPSHAKVDSEGYKSDRTFQNSEEEPEPDGKFDVEDIPADESALAR